MQVEYVYPFFVAGIMSLITDGCVFEPKASLFCVEYWVPPGIKHGCIDSSVKLEVVGVSADVNNVTWISVIPLDTDSAEPILVRRSDGTCQNKCCDCILKPCIYGTCHSDWYSYNCSCDPGYTGEICDKVKHYCSPNPCVHGQCRSTSFGYNCSCNQGYTGKNCQTVVTTVTTTTSNVSIHTCNKLGLLMALSSSASVSAAGSKSCSGTSADALLIKLCSSPPVSSWRKGAHINKNCSSIGKYTPIAQWKNNTLTNVSGVMVSCTGGYIQMISQTCGHGISLKNVTQSDVDTLYSVLW